MILSNLKTPLKEAILNDEKSSFDISNPSFTINNGGEKISVKAKKGKLSELPAKLFVFSG